MSVWTRARQGTQKSMNNSCSNLKEIWWIPLHEIIFHIVFMSVGKNEARIIHDMKKEEIKGIE